MDLAFVPTEDVRDYMQLILRDEETRGDGLLQEFAAYFQKIYVGQNLIRERFDRASWNMYERLKDNLPRTNNSVEGFHSAFAKNITYHPTLTKLSARYRSFQHKKGNEREQHKAGIKQPHSRKKYQKITERLKTQVRRLDSNILTGLPYLEQVAKVMTIPTD